MALKYLRNVWKTLEVPLIDCEVNLILTWSANYIIVHRYIANQGGTYAITKTKLYVPVVTFSTQDAQLLQQVQSDFKRLTNWYKNLSKPEILTPNRNLNILVNQVSKS